MWDFDNDFDTELDLGSRRKPVQWVAVAPPVTERAKQQVHKRAKVRQRKGAPEGRGNGDAPLSAKAKAAQAAQAVKQRQRAQSLKDEKTPAIASGVHNRTSEAVLLEPEDDEGNVEYKLRLKQPNPVRFQQLVTQMQYRLSEGNGECYYYLGIEDDGYPRGLTPQELEISYNTLKAMAGAVNATMQPLKEMPACKGRVYVIFRISRVCLDHLSYSDLRIAVAGSVDSGKSTLVAVLTNGRQGRPLLDNGQGSARMSVFKHKHEIETGRTSSLSHHMLAYDAEHRVLNYADVAPLMPSEIAAAARKVVRFIDLGGHQKYLKTALYGLTSLIPDYVIVCICPLTGITQVTKEHLAVALALALPVAFLITKVDVAPAEAVESVLESIQQLLEAASSGHCVTGLEPQTLEGPLYTLIDSEPEAIEAAKHATHPAPPKLKCVPVFSTAATTGAGLSTVHAFLSHLQPHKLQNGSCPAAEREGAQDLASEDLDEVLSGNGRANEPQPTHFQVDQTFEVRGVGSVMSGTLISGSVMLNQELMLGTQPSGRFTPVIVTSIQRAQVPVKTASAGQHATLAIHDLSERESLDHGGGSNQLTSIEAVLEKARNAPEQESNGGQGIVDVSDPPASETLPCDSACGTSAAAEPVDYRGKLIADFEDEVDKEAAAAPGDFNYPSRFRQSIDRRHDVWQCSPQSSPLAAQESGRRSSASLILGSSSSSVSGDSNQSNSPRSAIVPRPSQRHNPEEAASAMIDDLSLEELQSADLHLRLDEPAVSKLKGAHPESMITAELSKQQEKMSGANEKHSSNPKLAEANVFEEDGQSRAARHTKNMQKTGNPRKGTVLLDKALKPEAVWQFEAVMVLLSGFWPARGLLSGGWPPLGDSDGDDLLSDSCPAADSPAGSFDYGRTPPQRTPKAKPRAAYSPVVHCGSIRQAARVVSMLEVPLPSHWQIRDCCHFTGCNLEPAIAAAACLLAQPDSQEGLSEESCIAVVSFRFLHQPEWLQEGTRFVVRDCTESCTSGAGVVRQLLPQS